MGGRFSTVCAEMDAMTHCLIYIKRIFLFPHTCKYSKHSNVYRKVRRHLVRCVVAYFLFLSLIYIKRMTSRTEFGLWLCNADRDSSSDKDSAASKAWYSCFKGMTRLPSGCNTTMRHLPSSGLVPTFDNGRPSRSLGLISAGFKILLFFLSSERWMFWNDFRVFTGFKPKKHHRSLTSQSNTICSAQITAGHVKQQHWVKAHKINEVMENPELTQPHVQTGLACVFLY